MSYFSTTAPNQIDDRIDGLPLPPIANFRKFMDE